MFLDFLQFHSHNTFFSILVTQIIPYRKYIVYN